MSCLRCRVPTFESTHRTSILARKANRDNTRRATGVRNSTLRPNGGGITVNALQWYARNLISIGEMRWPARYGLSSNLETRETKANIRGRRETKTLPLSSP
jgi:hypothetical protein